jgi:hypothetical protein
MMTALPRVLAYTDLGDLARGDDAALDLTLFDEDNPTAPIDLTGCILRFTAKFTPQDVDAEAIFACDSNAGTIEVLNAAGGLARVHLAGARTSNMARTARLFWDVEVQYPDGTRHQAMRGYVRILADATLRSAPLA